MHVILLPKECVQIYGLLHIAPTFSFIFSKLQLKRGLHTFKVRTYITIVEYNKILYSYVPLCQVFIGSHIVYS